MSEFFQFEADFVESLRCIPMQVRLKLDTCGIKLKLQEWNKFTMDEREAVVKKPCTTAQETKAYRQLLIDLVIKHSGKEPSELTIEENPAWMDATNIPVNVAEKAQELGLYLTSEQWANLTPAQRFALIKLSRSSHENANFLPALKEFQLV